MGDKNYGLVYRIFFRPGEVVEVRAFGLAGKSSGWDGWARGIVSGYFDDLVKFAEAVASLDAAGADGVYYTANPVLPDLLSRACNRLVAVDNKRPTTSDKHVACCRWLLIDLDPIRPTGISSSADELEAAASVGRELTSYLETDLGWPAGIRGMSGNGYHIMYRLDDMPPGPEVSESGGILSRALGALAARFNTDRIKVDVVNHNASRIWKLYGTWARKGDSTAARPHRQSYLAADGIESIDQIGVVSPELVKQLAAQFQQPEQAQPSSPPQTQEKRAVGKGNAGGNQLGPLQVADYLAHYGIEVRGVKQAGASTYYLFDQCVFDPDHRGHKLCALVSSPTAPFLTYHCFHESCKGKTWKEARRLISGDDSIARFCDGYDPSWAPVPSASARQKKDVEVKVFSAPMASENLLDAIAVVPGSGDVPPPHEVSAWDFFENNDGKRPSFRVNALADYVSLYLAPMVHTSRDFWCYRDGVWKVISSEEVGKIAAIALHDETQTARVENTVKLIRFRRNMEEAKWSTAAATQGQLVNCQNGMLDVKNNQLLPHAPEYFSRLQITTPYDSYAECREWMTAIEQIFMGSITKMMLLQEYFGYCLLPTCRFEKAAFFFGTGANGKSTVLRVLEELLGADNVSALSLESLSSQFSLISLRNKMVNIATEVDTKDKAGTENLKKLISGDLMSSDTKYGSQVTFRTFCKAIFAMNTPPTITDKAYGFVRKVLVINFNRRFSDHERDKGLIDRLLTELPGVLNWAIAGAQRLIANGGFSEDNMTKREQQEFMAKMNPVLNYVQDRCVVSPGAWEESMALFDDYKQWSTARLYRSMGQMKFNDQLEALDGVTKDRPRIDGQRRTIFKGIGLRKTWGSAVGDEDGEE